MTYCLEFKRISIHSEKGKEGMHQDISELKTLFINHHRWHCVWKSPVMTASKWSSGTRYGHLWWVGLWWFGKRDMCACHNHGNKDKCGSSPTTTRHKPLVMHDPSRSSMHTTTCTLTWLHGGWETQWPHCAWLHSVLSLQADTSLYHCPYFCKFLPIFSFSLKLYWEHRLNSETSSNCELQKFSKPFAIRGMLTVCYFILKGTGSERIVLPKKVNEKGGKK